MSDLVKPDQVKADQVKADQVKATLCSIAFGDGHSNWPDEKALNKIIGEFPSRPSYFQLQYTIVDIAINHVKTAQEDCGLACPELSYTLSKAEAYKAKLKEREKELKTKAAAAAAAATATATAAAAAAATATAAATAAAEDVGIILIDILSLEREIETICAATHSEALLAVLVKSNRFKTPLKDLQGYKRELQNQIGGYEEQLKRYEDYKQAFLESLNVVSASLTAFDSWGGDSDYKGCGENDPRVIAFLNEISPKESNKYKFKKDNIENAAKRHFGHRGIGDSFVRVLATIPLLAFALIIPIIGYLIVAEFIRKDCENKIFIFKSRTRRQVAAEKAQVAPAKANEAFAFKPRRRVSIMMGPLSKRI